eukprot:2414120-Prymnesium_polylepis.1
MVHAAFASMVMYFDERKGAGEMCTSSSRPCATRSKTRASSSRRGRSSHCLQPVGCRAQVAV